jgi:hypothetical protein
MSGIADLNERAAPRRTIIFTVPRRYRHPQDASRDLAVGDEVAFPAPVTL